VGDADIPHARWRVRAENEEKSVSTLAGTAGFSLFEHWRITRSLFSRSRLQGDRFSRPSPARDASGYSRRERASRDGVTATRGALAVSVRVAGLISRRAPRWSSARAARGNPPRRSAACGGFRSPKRLRPGRSRACGTCPAVRRSNGVVEVRSGEVGADDGVEKRRSLAKAPLVSEVFQQKKTTRVGS
jgi:hypothetical protein